MADLPTHLIAVDTLQRFIGQIFTTAGTSAEEGDRIAYHLIGANLLNAIVPPCQTKYGYRNRCIKE